MPSTTIDPALQAKIQTIRQLARERNCSYFLPATIDQAEHEINRLVEIRVPQVSYGPTKPRLHHLCKALSQECGVRFIHPVNDADARQHIKRLTSMKVSTAAMIETRHHRPVYGTSGDFDTFGYGSEAYRDRGASMANSPSPEQMRFLANLASAAGEADPAPLTAREASEEIDRLRDRSRTRPTPAPRTAPPVKAHTAPATVKRPTPQQIGYLRDLARKAGEEITIPTTRTQTSAEIDRLLIKLGRKQPPTAATQR